MTTESQSSSSTRVLVPSRLSLGIASDGLGHDGLVGLSGFNMASIGDVFLAALLADVDSANAE